MEITTKYNVGDIVYVYDDNGDWEQENECPACSGKGFVYLDDGKDYTCPKCFGEGVIGCQEPINTFQYTICGINIDLEKYNNYKPQIYYIVKAKGKGGGRLLKYYETELYFTKEELLADRSSIGDVR